MKTYGRVAALDGGEWSVSGLCCFTPGERVARTHYVEDWRLGTRTDLGFMEKIISLVSAGNRTRTPRPSKPYPGHYTD
jgi:hypothetical protein